MAEDAGKKLSVVVNHKGTVGSFNFATIEVPDSIETEVLANLKKKKTLKMKVNTDGESSKKGDYVTVNKKMLRYQGMRGTFQEK